MKKFIILILVILMLRACVGLFNSDSNNNQPKTNMEQSRYNDMSPTDYHKEMKSENLEYADIAWHAQRTYGWNCEEITALGEDIKTSGKELRDPMLIKEIKGTYNIATCTSGVKLRVYPRYNTYPIITNINGTFD